MKTFDKAQVKVLYVITRGAYSNSNGQEALDAMLVGASFDLEVSVLFIHDGVFQLKRNQDVGLSRFKEFTKAYKALEDFGIENIYIDQLSMSARGLTETELMCDVMQIDSQAIRDLIADNAKVFTF